MATRVSIPIYRQRTDAQGALLNASSARTEVAEPHLARYLAPALDDLAKIEMQQQASRDESLYADVKAEAMKRTLAARETLAEDTDYGTHKERFGSDIENINKYAQDAFKDRPDLQRRFDREYGLYAQQQNYGVRSNAVRGINQNQVAALDTRMREGGAAFSLDPANNETVLSSMLLEVDRLQQTGGLSAVAAEKYRAAAYKEQDSAVLRLSVLRDPKSSGTAIAKSLGLPVTPGGASSAPDFAARFESGPEGSSAIGYDQTGGTSYGKFQISSQTIPQFLDWLRRNGMAETAEALSSSGPANTGSRSGPMPQAWKNLVSSGKITDDIQERFIRETHVSPALSGLPDDARALIEGNPALSAAVFSTAVQHGGGGANRLLGAAWTASEGDPAAFVDALYDMRETQFGGSSEETRQGVKRRLSQERAEVLQGIGGETETGAGVDPMLADSLSRMTVDEKARYLAQAQAAAKHADTEQKQRVLSLLKHKDDFLAHAMDTGDFSYLNTLKNELVAAGQFDAAAEINETEKLYSVARPYVVGAQNQPLMAQIAESANVFANLQTPQNAAAAQKIGNYVASTLQKRIALFQADPAGYVANDPSLQEEGLTGEQRIERSMDLQRQVGAGMGVLPTVIPAGQAKAVKEQYESLTDYGKKAEFATGLLSSYGKYAGQAAVDAKLPSAVVSIAQVAQGFTRGDMTKLIAAAEASNKDLPELDPAEKRNRDQEVRDSNFVRTLLNVKTALYPSEEQTQFYADMVRTLTNYSRMGGKMDDFQNNFSIINDDDMAIIMPKTASTGQIERALRDKKAGLLKWLDKVSSGLPPAQAGIMRENFRDAYDNGLWVYDGDGFSLIDKASGRIAMVIGQDDAHVRMSMKEIQAIPPVTRNVHGLQAERDDLKGPFITPYFPF